MRAWFKDLRTGCLFWVAWLMSDVCALGFAIDGTPVLLNPSVLHPLNK